jgi:hypothetical protein
VFDVVITLQLCESALNGLCTKVDSRSRALVWDASVCQGGQGRPLLPSAADFKASYAVFGFNDSANLDAGSMWPVAYELKELTAADEAKIGALVKKVVS